jgi:transcriptional regulator with XRE-family HTH domain
MTLENLGKQAGLTANYLSSIEQGHRRRGLSLDAACRIARSLNTSLPEMFGFRGLTGAEVEASRLVEALPAAVKAKLLDFLRVLTRNGSRR